MVAAPLGSATKCGSAAARHAWAMRRRQHSWRSSAGHSAHGGSALAPNYDQSTRISSHTFSSAGCRALPGRCFSSLPALSNPLSPLPQDLHPAAARSGVAAWRLSEERPECCVCHRQLPRPLGGGLGGACPSIAPPSGLRRHPQHQQHQHNSVSWLSSGAAAPSCSSLASQLASRSDSVGMLAPSSLMAAAPARRRARLSMDLQLAMQRSPVQPVIWWRLVWSPWQAEQKQTTPFTPSRQADGTGVAPPAVKANNALQPCASSH